LDRCFEEFKKSKLKTTIHYPNGEQNNANCIIHTISLLKKLLLAGKEYKYRDKKAWVRHAMGIKFHLEATSDQQLWDINEETVKQQLKD
jgi:hypothetical protein